MTTTMSKRTDIHRPTDMDPASYEYVGAFDPETGDPGARGSLPAEEYTVHGVTVQAYSPLGASTSALRTLLSTKGFEGGNYANKGTCDHCGARFRYTAVMHHIPTDTYIAIGETCLDNRFSLQSKADFDRLRKAAALDRAQQRIKTAAREFVANLSEPARTILDRETDLEGLGLEGYGLGTVRDIRNKIWNTYGNASEKAVAFAVRLVNEAQARKVQVAARKPEETIAHPVGRVTFDGVVIKRTWKDNEYGGGYKIIVKVCEGQNANGEDRVWLVWLSEPSKIATSFGDTVRITATLKQSDRPFWAWGSRPTGATITGHKDDQLPDALAD